MKNIDKMFMEILMRTLIYFEVGIKGLQRQINLQAEQIKLLKMRDDLALKIINIDKEIAEKTAKLGTGRSQKYFGGSGKML